MLAVRQSSRREIFRGSPVRRDGLFVHDIGDGIDRDCSGAVGGCAVKYLVGDCHCRGSG